MTEGPLAHYRAKLINDALMGEVVRDVVFKVQTHLDPRILLGRKFECSEAVGKNILICFGDFAIRAHLLLYGTIHIYNIDESLAKPESKMKILLIFNKKKLAIYNTNAIQFDYKNNTFI